MKYNIWLNPFGAIRTKPTKNTSIDAKLSQVDGMTPMALVVVSTDGAYSKSCTTMTLYLSSLTPRLALMRHSMNPSSPLPTPSINSL